MKGRPKNKDSWITYNCEICGIETTKRTCDYNKSEHHYCGQKCYFKSISGKNHYHYKAEIVQCEYCNADIERNQSRLKAQEHQFCNSNCHHKWMKEFGLKGEQHPIYNREQIECDNCKSVLELTPWEINRGEYHYCDRECMIEHRNKIGFYNGSNNKNWQGGIQEIHKWVRALPESRTWRNGVLNKDNYECQCCGSKEELNAHHIHNFGNLYLELDDELWNLDNGITLCKDCHVVFHAQFGNRNNSLEQIKHFLGYVA